MTEYIPPDVPLFLTPDSIPSGVFCRTLGIPDDPTWCALVDGALTPLMSPSAWRPFGAVTPQEAADQWRAMLYASDAGAVSCEIAQTPFWDTASDVEDTASDEDQVWYGEVTNPEAPPGELDFVENLALWGVSGLVALATGSVGVALAFHTVVSKFILIQKAGDVGETIRYVIDHQDYATIDTTGHAGELMATTIIADPSMDAHDILIVKTA